MSTLLADDLRATVFAESTIGMALSLKKKISHQAYLKLVERLADLQRSEEIEEQANSIDDRTGHPYICDCQHCADVWHGNDNHETQYAQEA